MYGDEKVRQVENTLDGRDCGLCNHEAGLLTSYKSYLHSQLCDFHLQRVHKHCVEDDIDDMTHQFVISLEYELRKRNL